MNIQGFISSAVLLAAIVFGSFYTAEAQTRAALSKAQQVTGDTFSYVGRTPRGANIYAVQRPSKAMLNAVDQGLGDLFAAARRNGYNRRLNYSDYTIYIARNDNRGSGGPAIAVGSAQYSGTNYDQGGYIYAAGMVISNTQPAFVIAEHNGDYGRVANVVRYEGEHIVLYHNDRGRYGQTADHSRGGGHPILQ